uniref:Tricorn protease homolog n=1 Tax=Thermogemmatispora argillosa TaxID=2045280 RepID=A0A455T8L9_9CHLR|nr:tricorn protease [Thermogemmatispora argillosa]
MPSQGYVRFPTIYRDQIVFVAEDDLWLVSSEGGRAERLTAGVGAISHPHFSPDGAQLAFVGHEEGPSEVFLMPAAGGPARRLTYQASSCKVLGWTPTGDAILYASSAGQMSPHYEVIYAVSPSGGLPRQLPYGAANEISFGPHGGIVLGRNIREAAYWKRYRGGTVGHLWCDRDGSGHFERLLRIDGNISSPCWVGSRIYFLSDHEGIGNVYSCTPEGEDLRRHTHHEDFYARNLSSDGERLVYHAGADLYLFDPVSNRTRRLEVLLPSQRTQRNRKFVSAAHYLDTYALHPQGHMVALTTRGKAFSFGNWEGPVIQYGEPDGVRYRFLEWLNDGRRLVAVCDAIGRETLAVFEPESTAEPRLFPEIEFGRALTLEVSPVADVVAISNHRNELLVIDLEESRVRLIDRSAFGQIEHVAWSPDGRWLAYSFPSSAQQTAIKLCNLESGELAFATRPVLRDVAPSFDPEGKFLYFLGYRVFNPVYDALQFDLNFPRGVKPYAIMLRRDQRSPFVAEPRAPLPNGREKEEKQPSPVGAEASSKGERKEEGEEESGEESQRRPAPMTIDLEGITERVLPFPVPEGRYRKVRGIKGKALFLCFPVEGALHSQIESQAPPVRGHIECYDLENHKYEWLVDGVDDFEVARDGRMLIYRSGHRLRVIKAGEKAPKGENGERASRETGWLDLSRVKVSVQPAAEWRQMFDEAWRLQREQFWDEDMSGIDWEAVHAQYAPLLERVASRSELSDLLWELQGELGTSHAYEMGGEYRHGPQYRQGFLGVDWLYDAEHERYRIARIVRGDPSDSRATSPLTAPGLNVAEGDAVLAINGQRVGPQRSPEELLVNQANNEVQLLIESAASGEVRTITVKALASERPARYRDWVERNRRLVHQLSEGKVGYIHIPDMGAEGYAEFHRSYLSEYDRPALLIDVRWNGGGHVSPLLLEKLARRRLGYDFPRWGQPVPYPPESPRGPMVALTNEQAGSDGDIFSHCFKLMGLGPLIGKRTWGGVVGISPRHRLVDGTRTTQPEFAFWFKDVGWNVENYGTDPDIEVDIAPQDYAHERDPQLERAVAEALRLLESYPVLEPKPGERPRRSRPRLLAASPRTESASDSASEQPTGDSDSAAATQ